jgi:hypothetical protein
MSKTARELQALEEHRRGDGQFGQRPLARPPVSYPTVDPQDQWRDDHEDELNDLAQNLLPDVFQHSEDDWYQALHEAEQELLVDGATVTMPDGTTQWWDGDSGDWNDTIPPITRFGKTFKVYRRANTPTIMDVDNASARTPTTVGFIEQTSDKQRWIATRATNNPRQPQYPNPDVFATVEEARDWIVENAGRPAPGDEPFDTAGQALEVAACPTCAHTNRVVHVKGRGRKKVEELHCPDCGLVTREGDGNQPAWDWRHQTIAVQFKIDLDTALGRIPSSTAVPVIERVLADSLHQQPLPVTGRCVTAMQARRNTITQTQFLTAPFDFDTMYAQNLVAEVPYSHTQELLDGLWTAFEDASNQA